MPSSPSPSQATVCPNLAPNHLNEDPFRDPSSFYPSVLATAIPNEHPTTTTTTNADPPVKYPPLSPFLQSLGGSTPCLVTPLPRTRRFGFAALVVAFYASTVILTAAIVLIVRNATGSTNGRLRATGVIMGLVGVAGVLASGLTAWGMWKNAGRDIEEQMRIDLELQRLLRKSKSSGDFAPGANSEPALGLAAVPLPLSLGTSQKGKRGSGVWWIRRTMSASGDHGRIVHDNATVEKEINVSESQEEKIRGSNQRRSASLRSSCNPTLRSTPAYLSSTSDAQPQPQPHQHQRLTFQDQKQHTRPPPPPQPTRATTTSTAHPHASPAWTHHLSLSLSSSSLSSSSISSSSPSPPLPLSIPPHLKPPPDKYKSQSPQDLFFLHTLAADMGSEDESTRQTKRKRGLEVAETWGALDDDEGDDEGEEDEESEMEYDDGFEARVELKNANASASTNGRRWGRVWGRRRKDQP